MTKRILLILVEFRVYDYPLKVQTGVQCRIAELTDGEISILQNARAGHIADKDLMETIDKGRVLCKAELSDLGVLGDVGKFEGIYVFERFYCDGVHLEGSVESAGSSAIH